MHITIHVETAGTLSTLINESEKHRITGLNLTGNLDFTDIAYIRDMAMGVLSRLDLSGANIINNTIRKYAFIGCSNLVNITMPDSVISIGYSAFEGCSSLTSISIPNSVTKIEDSAFQGCTNLTNATIPDSVTDIGSRIFEECKSLISVTIPNSVSSIDESDFLGCNSLKEFIVQDNNESFSAIDGVLFNKDKTTLIRYPAAKSNTDYTIPDSVTYIECDAFRLCENLTCITIPNSVTEIGGEAFLGCTNLICATIPDSVTDIGYDIFECCRSLISVTIPNNVTSIEYFAFPRHNSLKEFIVHDDNENFSTIDGVLFNKDKTSLIRYPTKKGDTYIIPNSVTSIESHAFDMCSLDSITIPNSVTDIWEKAFNDCFLLCELHNNSPVPQAISNSVFRLHRPGYCRLYVPEGSYDAYKNAKGWSDFIRIIDPYIIRITIHVETEGTLILPELTVESDNSKIVELTITGNLNDKDIEKIRNMAIYTYSNNPIELDLSDANIVNNTIEGYAFMDCKSLTNITIPDSVTSIEYGAFKGCTSLTKITIPDCVTYIGVSAFSGCKSLASITIPNSVTSIERWAFEECESLTEITIPNNVTLIENFAFHKCISLKKFIVSEENTEFSSIDGVLLNKDKTTLICYPSAKPSSTYIIPNSVKNIQGGTDVEISCFANTRYEDIESGSFEECSNLICLYIPGSISNIGKGAFYNCTSLKEFIVSEENSEFSAIDGVLYNKDKTKLICYPISKSDTVYAIPDSVTSIGTVAFTGCKNLKNIVIPNSVTDIGEIKTFDDCTSLTSITIPNGVTSIGSWTFRNCASLKSITIPNSVTYIGWQSFVLCESLTSITIPDSVTQIEQRAFILCSSLKEFIVSEENINFSTIEGVLFDKNKTFLIYYPLAKGEIYTIPNGVTDINDHAFWRCKRLISITIPDSLTSIHEDTFYDCTGLKEIHNNSPVPQRMCYNDYNNYDFFNGVDLETCKLYVPKGSYEAYKNAESWSGFTNIIEE